VTDSGLQCTQSSTQQLLYHCLLELGTQKSTYLNNNFRCGSRYGCSKMMRLRLQLCLSNLFCLSSCLFVPVVSCLLILLPFITSCLLTVYLFSFVPVFCCLLILLSLWSGVPCLHIVPAYFLVHLYLFSPFYLSSCHLVSVVSCLLLTAVSCPFVPIVSFLLIFLSLCANCLLSAYLLVPLYQLSPVCCLLSCPFKVKV
jgi:hypothetical protein